MRPIDADVLIEEYGDWYTEEGEEHGFIGTIEDLVRLCQTIELEPEHIHCKDCRWFEPDRHQCGRQICAVFYEDDYCSFAERCTDETD